MLVLTRKIGESVVIDGVVYLTVLRVHGREKVLLGIQAPRSKRVDRQEVYERRKVGQSRKGRGAAD